jgi:hypothetical protein
MAVAIARQRFVQWHRRDCQGAAWDTGDSQAGLHGAAKDFVLLRSNDPTDEKRRLQRRAGVGIFGPDGDMAECLAQRPGAAGFELAGALGGGEAIGVGDRLIDRLES